MLVDRLQAMSIAMYQAGAVDQEAPVPAVEEMGDDRVPDGKEEREQVVDVVASVLQKMEDQRRPRKSSMLRWRTTGAQRRMALRLLNPPPRLLTTSI
jgi:hypothetical protein